MAAILKPKVVTTTTSKYGFELTIIFLGHNSEGIPAQTIYLSCSVWEILINLHFGWQPYWITRWPPPKVLINPSFATVKNIVIATQIEFRYCLACEILSKQLLEGVHFAIQDGGPKSFPFKWKHWFLVSERSELSKNVYIYNSPKNMNENT